MVRLARAASAFAALLCTLAHAGPYDLLITQQNSAGNGNWIRFVVPPSPSPNTSGVLMYDGGSTLPMHGQIGSGLAWSGTTLSVNVQAASLTDSTATGRSVVTAADAAAARSAIGAGTGSGTVTSVTAGTGLSGGVITSVGTISLPNTGTAGTYSGVTTDAQGRVTAGTARSFSYTTRALNTCFQVSATRDASVSYAVDIVATLSLSGGQQGTVFLELFTDSGCTTGMQEVTRATNGNTGTLTVGLNTVQTNTARLQGVVPAGMYLRLRTVNDTGTPAFTARPGQEVLL